MVHQFKDQSNNSQAAHEQALVDGVDGLGQPQRWLVDPEIDQCCAVHEWTGRCQPHRVHTLRASKCGSHTLVVLRDCDVAAASHVEGSEHGLKIAFLEERNLVAVNLSCQLWPNARVDG